MSPEIKHSSLPPYTPTAPISISQPKNLLFLKNSTSTSPTEEIDEKIKGLQLLQTTLENKKDFTSQLQETFKQELVDIPANILEKILTILSLKKESIEGEQIQLEDKKKYYESMSDSSEEGSPVLGFEEIQLESQTPETPRSSYGYHFAPPSPQEQRIMKPTLQEQLTLIKERSEGIPWGTQSVCSRRFINVEFHF